MSHALIPGSFDPMTLGHLDLIKRTKDYFDKVTVAVMLNESKDYSHTLAQRAEMAKLTLVGIPGVEVVTDTGLLVDLFDRIGADVIVKGIRNEEDRAYEEKMAAWNLQHNPRAKTVFLQADEELADVSSTRAREMIAAGRAPHGLLSPNVIEYLRAMGELPASGEDVAP